MITITVAMFAIICIVMCLNLFDVPMSVAFKRICGVSLLVLFILWIIFNSGLHTGINIH